MEVGEGDGEVIMKYMKGLNKKELMEVSDWAEANEEKHPLAKAYWALMEIKPDLLMQLCDGVCDSYTPEDYEGPLVEGKLEQMDSLWFDARDLLGRACLVAIKENR